MGLQEKQKSTLANEIMQNNFLMCEDETIDTLLRSR